MPRRRHELPEAGRAVLSNPGASATQRASTESDRAPCPSKRRSQHYPDRAASPMRRRLFLFASSSGRRFETGLALLDRAGSFDRRPSCFLSVSRPPPLPRRALRGPRFCRRFAGLPHGKSKPACPISYACNGRSLLEQPLDPGSTAADAAARDAIAAAGRSGSMPTAGASMPG